MRSIKSKILIIILIAICTGYIICHGCSNDSFFEKEIKKYSNLLKEDPDNCLYNEQIAHSYQALNKLDEAIKHFKKVVIKCPTYLTSIFDLGVCYYVRMEKDEGLKYMDMAIQKAMQASDRKLEEMFRNEKQAWLEKWENVKQLDWNKEKLRDIL